jgi:hypothetical protein
LLLCDADIALPLRLDIALWDGAGAIRKIDFLILAVVAVVVAVALVVGR